MFMTDCAVQTELLILFKPRVRLTEALQKHHLFDCRAFATPSTESVIIWCIKFPHNLCAFLG